MIGRPKINPERAARIIALYQEMVVMAEIVASVKCSTATIYSVLREANIPHRGQIHRRPSEKIDLINSLIDQGFSYARIGALYGVSRQRIHQLINLPPIDN